MKKSLLFTSILLCISILVQSIVVAEKESVISIVADKTEIFLGDTVTIDIALPEAVSFRGIQFEVKYDFGKFTLEAEKDLLLEDAMVSEFDSKTGGKLKVAAIYDDIYELQGNICTLNLTTREKIGYGNTNVTISNLLIETGEEEMLEGSDESVTINVISKEEQKPDLPDDVPDIPKPENPIPGNTPKPETPTPENTPKPEDDSKDEDENDAPEEDEKPETGEDEDSDDDKKPTTGGNSGKPSKTSEPLGGILRPDLGIDIPKIDFVDMKAHWAKDDVAYLVSKSIVNGISATEFAPEKQVSRAEFVKMICGVLKLPKADTQAFSDVAPDAWYCDYVNRAAAAQLVLGDGDRFMPDDSITREQMAVIIYRALQYAKIAGGSGQLIVFADIESCSDWSRDAVEKLTKYSIINGIDGNFMPKKNATRAEAAVMIKRLLDKKESN